MKTMKTSIIRIAVITMLLILVPMLASALGNNENAYPKALSDEFTGIATALQDGELTREQALKRLHEFRTENKKDYNEDYQKMERLLNGVLSGEMTANQAQEQARLLKECTDPQTEAKLQAQTQNREQVKVQTTTQQQIETGTSNENKPEASGSGSADKAKSKK
ncbi:MAG TPA: hypothetical protein DCO79_00090 [Spirochaeta sp.]|nr:hypothetical protein [Spirochaeta sp.]